jgi:hypothetical protein
VPTDDHLFNILPSDVKKGLLFDTVDGIAARWAAAMRYAGTNEQSSHNSALSAAR